MADLPGQGRLGMTACSGQACVHTGLVLPPSQGWRGQCQRWRVAPRTPPPPHRPAAGLSTPAEPGHKHQARCERPKGGPVTLSHPGPGWGRLAEGAPHQVPPPVSLSRGRAPVREVGLDSPGGCSPASLPLSFHTQVPWTLPFRHQGF